MFEDELLMTLIGGPTVLIEYRGFRLLTDPTFDPPGLYKEAPVRFEKTTGPALSVEQIGRIDAVLLSHDQHYDNLDAAGRNFLTHQMAVYTTNSGAQRLGRGAKGLAPFESCTLHSPSGTQLLITATPARHGPIGVEAMAGEVIGFAEAWLKGAAAAKEAEARQKALTEAIRTGVDVELRARQLLQEAIADQAAAAAKSADDLDAQASAQHRLNDAVSVGTLSSEEARRQMAVEQALRPLIVAEALAEGDARETLTRVVDALRGAYIRSFVPLQGLERLRRGRDANGRGDRDRLAAGQTLQRWRLRARPDDHQARRRLCRSQGWRITGHPVLDRPSEGSHHLRLDAGLRTHRDLPVRRARSLRHGQPSRSGECLGSAGGVAD